MMWLEIFVVFSLGASVGVSVDSDDGEAYHNYKIHEDEKVDILQDLNPEEGRGRRSDGVADDGNATLAPEDVEVIKGAIQRLLGNLELPAADPTSPTRSAAPQPETTLSTTLNTTLTVTLNATTIIKLLTQLMESASDAPPTTVSMKATRSSYTKLLGELVEYADMMHRTKKPPVWSSEGQIRSWTRYTAPVTPRAVAAEEEAGDEEWVDEALRQRGRGRGGRKRTTTTTRPTRSTRNTLCTHDADVCATMCFDEEKYRVSCPPTTVTVPVPRVDVSRLLGMLSSLLEHVDTNLTEQFRLRLIKEGYASCWPKETTESTTTLTTEEPMIYDYEESNKTGAVISKCFVCGLLDDQIPMNAHCSDAFAGEFLPMTPVDASARGHLASYRKYCKFMDMVGWYVNGTDSRSIWGRWTGGCSVRWVDLSGVYTQRTCRNRFRPIRGHHFVSKRMAKLENALRYVDNGCIISPMASLVPFSRGISLYARFHACVCTGNWCNRSKRLGGFHWLLVLQTLLLMPYS